MNRAEFLSALRAELERQYISGADNMTEYYDEMICDRMEEGMSEEEAVASLGSIEDIVNEALIDRPMTTIVRDRVKKSKDNAEKKGHGALWITLAILGFPVWFPLMLSAAIVAFVLFLVFWILVGTVFIVIGSLALSAVACLAAAITFPFGWISIPSLLVALGGALALGSIVLLLWRPMISFSKAAGRFFADIVRSIKRKFV